MDEEKACSIKQAQANISPEPQALRKRTRELFLNSGDEIGAEEACGMQTEAMT